MTTRYLPTAFWIIPLVLAGGASCSSDDPNARPDGAVDGGGADASDGAVRDSGDANGWGEVPPDPATIAPPGAPGVTTDFGASVAFLYDAGGIQTGVVDGAIDARRISVLRGAVLDRNGEAVSGARVRVLDHPEWGETRTQADGRYDLVVNGGGRVIVRITKAGYIESQRQVYPPFQDFAKVDDVVLVALDPIVTMVQLGMGAMQVAGGSTMSDEDGTRQARVLFPAGTTAEMVMADGSTVALSTANVRATEFTVGPRGRASMPGVLPASSAYTYAVELSVDEAIAADATEVRFSSPVILHVENFLGAPVGGAVPLGWFDRQRSVWVPADNGRVIAVVAVNDGIADVDLDGDGEAESADDLVAFGITEAERQELATRFPSGASLWRSAIPHFTPWDTNWPYVLPDDAEYPDAQEEDEAEAEAKKHPCLETGSVIGCESQVLGESIAVLGTPFHLTYSSARVPARLRSNRVKVALTGPTVPASVLEVIVEVEIAGRLFTESFAPAPNLEWEMEWDRRDAYGRTVEGRTLAHARVGYRYPQIYRSPPYTPQPYFGTPSPPGGSFSRIGGADSLFAILWRESIIPVAGIASDMDARLVGLGGWTLNAHHVYDGRRHGVLGGNGIDLPSLGDGPFTTDIAFGVAGVGRGGRGNNPALGGDAAAAIVDANDLAPHPDGGFWYVSGGESPLMRVTGDGEIMMIGCHPDERDDCEPLAEGMHVANAQIETGFHIASGPDGSVFFSDPTDRIWRIDPDNVLHWIGGAGGEFPVPLLGNVGGVARDYDLAPDHLAYDPQGYLYFVHDRSEVYRISPDGRLEHVAGAEDGDYRLRGENGPASEARFDALEELAVSLDGVVYLAHEHAGEMIVLRIAADGLLTRFAGVVDGVRGCTLEQSNLAGVERTAACFSDIRRFAAEPSGALLAYANDQVIRLDAEITVLAGGARTTEEPPFARPFSLQLDPALAARYGGGVFFSTRERVYALDANRAAQVRGDNTLVASPDGVDGWLFDPSGRHVETRDLLTGGLRYTCAYGDHGLLTSITDGSGHVTRIERTDAGVPTAIVAPAGQRTTLTLDAQGFLSRVEAPGRDALSLTYAGLADGFDADAGLLKSITMPSGETAEFTWDERARLLTDRHIGGGVTTLAREEFTGGFEVTVTNPAGRVRRHRLVNLEEGGVERTVIQPSGATTTVTRRPDGSLSMVGADGTEVELAMNADPRFGQQLPYAASVQVRKGTLTTDAISLRDLGTPPGLFGDGVMTETSTIEGDVWTLEYDATNRSLRRTTPEGRVQEASFDALGRMASLSLDPALEDFTRTYDANGFVATVAQGSHAWELEWNAEHLLSSVTDASDRTIAYTFDEAARPASVTYPSGSVGISWDDNDNLTSFTMPRGGAHAMVSDARGRQTSYLPPGNAAAYRNERAIDGALTRVILPSGRTQMFSYDAGGRITGITYPEATVAFTYAGATELPATLVRTPSAGTMQSLAFEHDADLPTRLTFTGAATGTYDYSYSQKFLVSNITLSNVGTDVSYSIRRDDDGLLTEFGPLEFERSGPGGAVSSIGDGGSNLAFTYTAEGQPAGRALDFGGAERYRVQATYDASGIVASRVEAVDGTSRSFAYTHDGDGRLTRVTRDGMEVEAYAYDTNGNRTSAAYNGLAATEANYDMQDRIMSRGATSYTVDTDGFVTAIGATALNWTSTGELRSATVGATTITYDYDALRRRVRRTEGTNSTQYLYGDVGDPFRVTASIASSGTLTTYLYDEGGYVVAFERGGARYFVGTDHVGSPRVITNSSGAVVGETERDSFGRVLASSGSVGIDLGFAGGLNDPTTGLLRFGFRDYEPASGRWLARDPAFLSGRQFNLYAYVGSSPVSFRDPTGLICVGASSYNGVGGGASICFGSSGVSACGEFGFGKGGGLEINPFAQPDHTTYLGVEASLGGNLGPFAGASGELKYGQYGNPYDGGIHCFRGDGGFKGSLIGVETDLSGAESIKSDPAKPFEAKDALRAREVDVELEGKAIFKGCGSLSNLF